MLHCTGNYGGEPASGRGTPAPTPTFSPVGRGSVSIGGVAPPLPHTAMSEQLRQLREAFVSVVHDDLIDTVPDATVQKLLRLTDQLETLSAAATQSHNSHFSMSGSATLHTGASTHRSSSENARISIAVPTLTVPPRPITDSPNVAPVSANTRIKTMDLNDIPHCRVESYNNHTSGEVSPVTTGLQKRTKSVVFFQHHDVGLDPAPSAFDEEGHRFVARSYSGFGSFRKASRHQSMVGGDLQQITQRALSFHANGMPAFDLGGDDEGGIRCRFSRPIARHTDVFAADPDVFIDECSSAASAPLIPLDVSDLSLDLLAIDGEEPDILRSVAVHVFAQYNCMRPHLVDTSAFLAFVDAVSRYNNVTNPHRNGVHTAETLLGVHQYLRQPDVANNFTDGEITTLLIAALCFNLGYLGVTNEFLLQLNHPLARVFSIVNTSESVATMIGLQLLDQYNFLAKTCGTADMYWLGILEGVADLLSSSSPREHQQQLRHAVAMTERGFVSDAEVPLLLSCVLRAAAMRFCCMPKQQHIRHAALWVNEAFKQSECERILGFDPSARQWTDDTAWASVQAFVTIVAAPYFEALRDFFPETWGQNLTDVAALYGTVDSPIANTKASFADGGRPLSVTVDTGVPEWSDQSSLALTVLSSIIPQHLLMTSTSAGGGRNRTDHYFSFLQLYDASEGDVRRRGDFGGNLVQLAMRLDPLYIGEYASALIDEEDFSTYADAAAIITRTEATPDPATVLSPARRQQSQSSDPFIVLLLRMMAERSHAPPSDAPASAMSSLSASGGGSAVVNASTSAGERTSIMCGGPFRGKWRLTTGGNSVYDAPRRGQ